MTCCALPLNGGAPVSSRSPDADGVQIRAMIGGRIAVACSGAMYCGVPSANPADVIVPDSRSAFAIPKSATTRAGANQHILGLDVAMHHAVLVREGQRVQCSAQQAPTSRSGADPARYPCAQRSPLTNGMV